MTIQSLTISVLLLIVFGTSSCKKESYNVEYIIKNRSLRNISIIYKKIGSSLADSNLIASGQSLIFLIEFGDGQTSKDFINGLDSIPVEFLSITDTEQNHLSWDEQNLDNWHAFFSDGKKQSKATMTTRIKEQDFE